MGRSCKPFGIFGDWTLCDHANTVIYSTWALCGCVPHQQHCTVHCLLCVCPSGDEWGLCAVSAGRQFAGDICESLGVVCRRCDGGGPLVSRTRRCRLNYDHAHLRASPCTVADCIRVLVCSMVVARMCWSRCLPIACPDSRRYGAACPDSELS